MSNLPLISCVMVTQESRFRFLRRAVACFRRQTYPNCELLTVFDGSAAFRDKMERFGESNHVRTVYAGPGGQTLGRLRNISVSEARGSLVCQWDDDDVVHPLRVETQYHALAVAGASACYLADQLYVFARARRLYYRSAEYIYGTPLFRKDIDCPYPESGPRARKGEDTSHFSRLKRHQTIARVTGMGWLYVRVYHGDNTWRLPHHRNQIEKEGLTAGELQTRELELRDRIAETGLTNLHVCGKDGPAFRIFGSSSTSQADPPCDPLSPEADNDLMASGGPHPVSP